ncbi:hypothetical protein F5Y12DRAFT_729912, partial [Xylaria sp. FL1777]
MMHLGSKLLRYKRREMDFAYEWLTYRNSTACASVIQQESTADRCTDRCTDGCIKIAQLLLPDTSDLPLRSFPLELGKDDHNMVFLLGLNCLPVLLQHAEFAEAAGCEALSLAAMMGDEKRVQDIIRRHPQSSNEVNQFGHTPLHLAINHPACLCLILQVCEPSTVNKLDVYGASPLECASLLGYTASTELLLESGCYINPNWIFKSHESCRDTLLVTLKQRRDRLKSLALDTLGQMDAKRLGLHEDAVLDSRAIEVEDLLKRKGVHIPSSLKGRNGSVYHCPEAYRDISILEKLWALGFRDIDSVGPQGSIPLILHVRPRFENVRWLIEHGANYWTPISERSDSGNRNPMATTLTPAHGVLRCIGLYESDEDEDLEAQLWLVEKLSQFQATDLCSCLCTISGSCTPLKMFLDSWFYKMQWATKRSEISPPPLHVSLCMTFIQTYKASLDERGLIDVVRRATFDALELTHTCSQHYRIEELPYDSDEVNAIHSEQVILLSLFEDLLVEFEQLAFEDQSGSPLITSDPEEFWLRRWLPRMTETLDSLDGHDLTEEEILAAEAIGVVWAPQPAPAAQTVDKKSNDMFTPEWVLSELEKIMN